MFLLSGFLLYRIVKNPASIISHLSKTNSQLIRDAIAVAIVNIEPNIFHLR
jgi:hypothetical protein